MKPIDNDDTTALRQIRNFNMVGNDSTFKISDEKKIVDAYRYIHAKIDDAMAENCFAQEDAALIEAKAYYTAFQQRCESHIEAKAEEQRIAQAQLQNYYDQVLPKSIQNKRLRSSAEKFYAELKIFKDELRAQPKADWLTARQIIIDSLQKYPEGLRNLIFTAAQGV